MKVSGTLSGFNNSIVDIDLYIGSPYSGFEITAMETGAGSRENIFAFSGKEGLIYDQTGRFFGGYKSGDSLNLQVHYNKTAQLFSYYYDGDLVCNNMVPLTSNNSINSIEFDKHGSSSLNVSISGILA